MNKIQTSLHTSPVWKMTFCHLLSFCQSQRNKIKKKTTSKHSKRTNLNIINTSNICLLIGIFIVQSSTVTCLLKQWILKKSNKIQFKIVTCISVNSYLHCSVFYCHLFTETSKLNSDSYYNNRIQIKIVTPSCPKIIVFSFSSNIVLSKTNKITFDTV